MKTQTVLHYRVTHGAETKTCKTYAEALAAAEEKGAQIEPVFADEDKGLTYQEATQTPSPLAGVAMSQLNPAQLVEVIRGRLRGTAAQVMAARIIIEKDYGIGQP